MPLFAYEAINAQGQKETGELEAANRNQAIIEIRNAGLKPTKVAQRAETAATKKAAKQEAGPARTKGGKIRGKASAQQLTDFTAQLAVLIDAGLPVVRSLKVLGRQQKPGAFKHIIEDISESVEQGSSLSEAFANHPRTFDRLYVNMIKAGEAGGILDTILQRLADFMEKAQRLKKKVIGAMIYPIIVMSVAVMILTGIMIFVIPAFEKMFKEQGMELHWMTAMLIWISNSIASWKGLLFAVVVTLAVVGMMAWGRTTTGERVMDSVKLKLPIFGNIIKKAVTARFTFNQKILMGVILGAAVLSVVIFSVWLRSEEKAAFWTLANRARLTASALARRRLLGLKVRFEPQQAAVEYLRQACVLMEALAAKRAGVDDEDIAAILAAQRAAMDCLGADLHGATREQAPR